MSAHTVVVMEGGVSLLVQETPYEIDKLCWGFDNRNRQASDDTKQRFIHLSPVQAVDDEDKVLIRPRSIGALRRVVE
jgi:hypothetical protein